MGDGLDDPALALTLGARDQRQTAPIASNVTPAGTQRTKGVSASDEGQNR